MRTLGVISKIDQTTGKPKVLALALAAIQALCYDQEALLISHDFMSCVNLLNIVNRYHFWNCFWLAETESLKNILFGLLEQIFGCTNTRTYNHQASKSFLVASALHCWCYCSLFQLLLYMFAAMLTARYLVVVVM